MPDGNGWVDGLMQEAPSIESTGDSACYFPLANGRYEVKPGLLPLETDFGNGERDRQVFQFDSQFSHYRHIKQCARAERLGKVFQTERYSDAVAGAIVRLIVERLVQESPQHFRLAQSGNTSVLSCGLTGEVLHLGANGTLERAESPAGHIEYAAAIDALAMQVPEDLAVVCRSPAGEEWVGAIHLCYPNHWSAEEKVGRNFATVHAPVAGMEKMNQRGGAIVHTMVMRRPMVRFSWGLSTDARLNHHPVPPIDLSADTWQGRQFDPSCPRLFLRIERQVIWGLPEHGAALFAIRTYFRDCAVIKRQPELCALLCSALRSMSLESLRYKGVVNDQAAILDWLTAG